MNLNTATQKTSPRKAYAITSKPTNAKIAVTSLYQTANSQNENDKKYSCCSPKLLLDGMSLRKTQRNLEQVFGEKISQVTILNWIRNTHNS